MCVRITTRRYLRDGFFGKKLLIGRKYPPRVFASLLGIVARCFWTYATARSAAVRSISRGEKEDRRRRDPRKRMIFVAFIASFISSSSSLDDDEEIVMRGFLFALCVCLRRAW